jgi:hypothetical protein
MINLHIDSGDRSDEYSQERHETSLKFDYSNFLIVFGLEGCYCFVLFTDTTVRLSLIDLHLDCHRTRVC